MKRNISIGFYGQSGSGKTSLIKNLPGIVEGRATLQNTGIIRSLFEKNSGKYQNPNELINLVQNKEMSKIHALDRYVRSQFQLLNDFSTEVFSINMDGCVVPAIMLYDRTPLDFYTLTLCGLEYMLNTFELKKLPRDVSYMLNLMKDTTEHNTRLLLDQVIVVHPWNSNNSNLMDGVRDQYLTDYYVGNNWYNKINETSHGVNVHTIPVEMTDLNSRVLSVTKVLKNI